MIVLQCSNIRISIETIYFLYWCLGKKPTTPGEGTENEDSVNRQGTGDQGVRRRAANQNRGLRAQLQASRRARLARINEDEQDGMLIRIYIAIFFILNDVITVTRSLVLDGHNIMYYLQLYKQKPLLNSFPEELVILLIISPSYLGTVQRRQLH